MRRVLCVALLSCVELAGARSVLAQTTIYHLHKEASVHSAVYQQLKTAGPDPAAFSFQKNLKNLSPNQDVALAFFETQPSEPIPAGDIPAGTIVTFTLWMRKSANFGTSHPAAAVYRNNFQSGTWLCGAGGSFSASPALTQTLTKYTLTCTVSSAVSMSGSDRFHLAVYAWIAAGAGNKNVNAEVHVEGVLDGNYDSQISIAQPPPPPTPPVLAGLSPVSGVAGTPVTVTGTYFGATQGGSTVKFNGVTASPTTWSANSITAPVPASATSGPIVVTVGGLASNSLMFIVNSSGSVSGTVTRASNGAPVSGATVQILQSGAVKTSSTTNGSGQYSTGSLPAGFYDARVSASGFFDEVVTSFTVGGGAVTTVNASMKMPGTLSGQVTEQGGGPLAGAAVVASLSGVPLGSTTTNAAGTYSVDLRPGSYAVEASAPGYAAATQSGAAVTESATTTANLTLSAVGPTTVSYTYDELGRLVGVTDATGDTARYTYDAVGNLLTIARQATSQISILEFSPNLGPVGTPVTIRGTGFSTTPSENAVTFNGTTAIVTLATASQLSVTVPASATTGPLTVMNASGSATGPGNFTVAQIPGPTISGVSPSLAVIGTPITISGTNFKTTPSQNAVSVNTAPAVVGTSTATSIASTVPPGARSGRVWVTTSLGTAASPTPLYIVPAPYVIGNVGSTIALPYDTPTFIPIAQGKVSIGVFEGSGNQRVNVFVAAGGCLDLKLYDTDDDTWMRYSSSFYYLNPHEAPSFDNAGQRIYDARVLPSPGSYQLLVSACDTGTSGATVTVRNLPPDHMATIVPSGAPVTSPITTVGQNALLNFQGTAGQRVSYNVTKSGFGACGAGASIFPPVPDPAFFGQAIGALGCVGFLDPIVLPTTGTYTIFINPDVNGTGSVTSTLYDVPPDPSGQITPGGSPFGITTTVPGQRGVYTFAGSMNQRVSFLVTNSTYSGTLALSFQRADGTVLRDSLFDNFLDATTLPAAETYTVLVDPWQMQTGSATLTLFDVPPDSIGSTTVNGVAVPFTATVPGHNASITFSGTASQSVTIRGTTNSIGCTFLRLYRPDGTQLASTHQCGELALGPVTLPVTGTYTIQVDPNGPRTGSVNVSVTSP